MQPIFLIGYMGCGKSTLGRLASSMSHRSFIDLDSYIEGRFHATVKEIFAAKRASGSLSAPCFRKSDSLRMSS